MPKDGKRTMPEAVPELGLLLHGRAPAAVAALARQPAVRVGPAENRTFLSPYRELAARGVDNQGLTTQAPSTYG